MTGEGGSTVRVRSDQGDYDVVVEPAALERLPTLLADPVGAHRYAVVSDSNVAPLHAEPLVSALQRSGIDATLFTFPAGEASKTRKSWSILTDEMLDAGFGRDCAVVAVGGGVTTDLGGFVAATFLRGVPVVQVPTSYLAMIDASVGSKTGVDVRAGKNLVGAFHAPSLVVADPLVLETLPVAERAQGLVEAFKHGAILDGDYFDELEAAIEAALATEAETAARLIVRSVRHKAAVVADDEREAGRRQILNFGHTVGHALEAASGFALGHGSAVALGMVAEAELGERLGVTEAGTADRLTAALDRLLEGTPRAVDLEAATPYLRSDKKVRRGALRCVLLGRIGSVAPGEEGWTHEVSEANVIEAVERRS